MQPPAYALTIVNDLFDEDLDPDLFEEALLAEIVAMASDGDEASGATPSDRVLQ